MTTMLPCTSDTFRLFARRGGGSNDPTFLSAHPTMAEAQAEMESRASSNSAFPYKGLVIAPPGFMPDFWA